MDEYFLFKYSPYINIPNFKCHGTFNPKIPSVNRYTFSKIDLRIRYVIILSFENGALKLLLYYIVLIY